MFDFICRVCLCIREKAVSIQYNKNGTFAHTDIAARYTTYHHTIIIQLSVRIYTLAHAICISIIILIYYFPTCLPFACM